MTDAWTYKRLLALMALVVVVLGGPRVLIAQPIPDSSAEVSVEATRYRLGAGDVIGIRVFGEPDLSFDRIRLSDAATVPYPLLGEVRAKGRTPVELERLISESLREGFLVNPRVTVNVIEYRQFYVNGEVASPGGFPFQPGMTVRKAIALAGGKTDRASSSKMFVNRDSELAGVQRQVTLDAPLMPGDILTVEESFF